MLHTPYQSRHLGYWALGSQNSCYIHLEPHRNHSVHPHTINQILISNPYTSQLYTRTIHSHLILILMLHTPYQSRHLGYWALGSQNSCYIHLEPHRNHSVHPHTINQILISNPYTSQLYIRTLHSHLILILMHARASRLLGLRLISRILFCKND